MLQNLDAKMRYYCEKEYLSKTTAQVSGDVRSNNFKLNVQDYRGMLLHHSGNQKMPMSKSETQPLAQEAPEVPQWCPMGPKFWSQNFSHTILR